jgi:hypothetical protein
MDKQDQILHEMRNMRKELREANIWQQKTDEYLAKIVVNQESNEKMITQLLQIVGATNSRVVRIEDRVDSPNEDISKLTEATNQLVEAIENVRKQIENQEEVIQILTTRSLQQENEIKEIQQMKSA